MKTWSLFGGMHYYEVHYGTSAGYFVPNEHLKAQAAAVAKQPCKQSPVSQVDKKAISYCLAC
jgi:hypothetical protein